MRNFIFLSCAAALLVIAASCRKEVPLETEFLSKTESVAVSADGGRYSINYTLINPVEGREVNASSEDGWISGFDCSKSGSVSFTVAPNETYESRSGEVLVEYGELNFSVPVNQSAGYDVTTPCTVFLSTYFGDAYETYTHFFMMADRELGEGGNYDHEGAYYVIYLTRNIDEETATAAFTSGEYTVDPESSYEDWTISAKESYVIYNNTQYSITEGTLTVSGEDYNESTFDLTVTLDDGSVHHAEYNVPSTARTTA